MGGGGGGGGESKEKAVKERKGGTKVKRHEERAGEKNKVERSNDF